jgi:hypothetical protein
MVHCVNGCGYAENLPYKAEKSVAPGPSIVNIAANTHYHYSLVNDLLIDIKVFVRRLSLESK